MIRETIQCCKNRPCPSGCWWPCFLETKWSRWSISYFASRLGCLVCFHFSRRWNKHVAYHYLFFLYRYGCMEFCCTQWKMGSICWWTENGHWEIHLFLEVITLINISFAPWSFLYNFFFFLPSQSSCFSIIEGELVKDGKTYNQWESC